MLVGTCQLVKKRGFPTVLVSDKCICKQEFGEKPRIWADLVFIYVYASPRTGSKDGKIDMKSLVLTRMKKMEMKDIEELLNGHIPNHTLISKILKISRVYSVKLLSSLLNY